MSHDHSWTNLRQINEHIEIVISLEGNPSVRSVIIIEEICSAEGCSIGRDGVGVEYDIRQGTRRMEEGSLSRPVCFILPKNLIRE